MNKSVPQQTNKFVILLMRDNVILSMNKFVNRVTKPSMSNNVLQRTKMNVQPLMNRIARPVIKMNVQL
jgi:hypothetical protein